MKKVYASGGWCPCLLLTFRLGQDWLGRECKCGIVQFVMEMVSIVCHWLNSYKIVHITYSHLLPFFQAIGSRTVQLNHRGVLILIDLYSFRLVSRISFDFYARCLYF